MAPPASHLNAPIDIGAQDWTVLQQLMAAHMLGWQVWAFGSRARRTAKPYSDLDLALLAPHALSLQELARVNDAFDASDLTIKVDVVDVRAVNDAFKAVIDRDKVLLLG